MSHSRQRWILGFLGVWLPQGLAMGQGQTWVVAAQGGDFSSIQAGLNAAVAGDTVLVRSKPGGWAETLVFPRGGSAAAGFLSLEAWPGERPVLDGTGASAQHMVLLRDVSWVRVQGFEIRNLTAPNDGSGVRVEGAGEQIEILDNWIHDLRGVSAMGITCYGSSLVASLRDLRIEDNLVEQCDPAPSEAITLNGDVERFVVANNTVRDVNNIGIDFIGGETWLHPTGVARDGVCSGNTVERARSSYGGGFGAGIYVDGGRDIEIVGNTVRECDLGIEIGAENAGLVTSGVVVRDNLVEANDKVGIVFGGYNATVGRVHQCVFEHNTVVGNDTLGVGLGQLWIQFADQNRVEHNVFVNTVAGVPLIYSDPGQTGTTLANNLWFDRAGNGLVTWSGTFYSTYAAFQQGLGLDPAAIYGDPLFVDAVGGDYRLTLSSPAVDAGDPTSQPLRLDHQGQQRWSDGNLDGQGAVDLGALERAPATVAAATAAVPAGFETTLTLDGDAGVVVGVLLGLQDPAGTWLPSPGAGGGWGALWLDPSVLPIVAHFGSATGSAVFALPPAAVPFADSLMFQGLAIGPSGSATLTAPAPVELP